MSGPLHDPLAGDHRLGNIRTFDWGCSHRGAQDRIGTLNRETRWRPNPLALLWQIAAISTWSSIPVLGCIEAPTLVVCGDRDRAVSPANSRLLAARIRDAHLVTIRAGHDLQKPGPAAIVGQLVEQFLDSEISMPPPE